MAMNQTTKIALAIAIFGSLSFIFGVIAENKKPHNGTPIKGKDIVICKFPSDPVLALGCLSVVTLFLAAVTGHVAVYYPYKGKSVPHEALTGHVAVYYPYKGKSVPHEALFRSATSVLFFVVAEAVSVLALGMMMWASVSEAMHRLRNVHRDLGTECPTAKTGLFGGAAFLALDAALFWLVCQMLTLNARADYLEEDGSKGECGEI